MVVFSTIVYIRLVISKVGVARLVINKVGVARLVIDKSGVVSSQVVQEPRLFLVSLADHWDLHFPEGEKREGAGEKGEGGERGKEGKRWKKYDYKKWKMTSSIPFFQVALLYQVSQWGPGVPQLQEDPSKQRRKKKEGERRKICTPQMPDLQIFSTHNFSRRASSSRGSWWPRWSFKSRGTLVR